MYTIYADGELIYSPSLAGNDAYALINPRMRRGLNAAGSVSFMMLPTNRGYDTIKKLKSIVQVYQDGEEVFSGRVLDINTDTFLQKTVYCEGELAYLNDSMQRPYEFEGNVHALFSEYITKHNALVEAEKQFMPGIVTATDAEEETHVKCTGYADTFSEITNRLLNVYGGYLKIRRENGVKYLDYLANYAGGCAQTVSFGANLIDIQAGGNADNIFTVLIPLGAPVKNGDETAPLTIESVNNGNDTLEDADGIAKYGRIVRTQTWSHIDNATDLLTRGQEYLQFGIQDNASISLRAVDMHLIDGSIEAIDIGQSVNIISEPHGIERPEICAEIDADLINPENTVYTFGEAKKTLTENVVEVAKKMSGGGGTGMEEEMLLYQRWAQLFIDENEALIHATVGQVETLTGLYNEVSLTLDGVIGEIELKVDKNGVISSINQSAENITIAANKINLTGYVTASEFSASIADLQYANSLAIETNLITATQTDFTYLKASSFTYGNEAIAKVSLTMGGIDSGTVLATSDTGSIDLAHSHRVIIEQDGSITLGEVSATGGNFNIADTQIYRDGVSAAINSVYLSSAGWVNGTNIVTATNGRSMIIGLPSFVTSGGGFADGAVRTTVYFSTPSVSTPLASITVNAQSVYDDGYNAGWRAASARFKMEWPDEGSYDSTLQITHAGSAPNVVDIVDEIEVGTTYTLEEIRNTAVNTFYVSGWAYARTRLNGGSWTNRHRANMTQTTTINVGQQ